jgi:L-alanine-DL-glutamate epimerase-like enolase superfamily enzyme
MADNHDPITGIRTQLLALPWPEPPTFAVNVPAHQEFLVTEVETRSGLVGMGYLQPLAGGLRTLQCCIHEMLKPLLVGEDPADVEGLWDRMWDATYIQGRMGITVMAMSALDIALWDLAGKRAGLPLHELWGGTATDLATYGSGCYRGSGKQGMIEKAERYVDAGFSAIKMQVAHIASHAQDIENVAAMRAALGADVDIMVDVNQGWSAAEAIEVGLRLDESDIYWLEEPVLAHDFDGYRQVAAALRTRVVGGENHFTHHDLKPFFDQPCLPILQPDVMRGGFTGLRRIAAIADSHGISIAPHLFPELMAHLLASIPNGSWLEYMGWHDDLWVTPVVPEAGVMRPPTAPGHGLAFKPELLTDYRVTR